MWRLLSVIAVVGAALWPALPARADGATACARVTVEHPRIEACNAEIAANPAPNLPRPVALDTKTQGASTPRSVLLPKDGTPYPIGWVLKDWYYSDAPGVQPPAFSKDRIVAKAALVYLYATVHVKGMDWHLIGPDQWIAGEHVAALRIAKRPEKVSGGWIALDLTEQTLVVFEGDTPIFATLISAAWDGYGLTREGLFNIYARTKSTVFRGPPWSAPNYKYIYSHTPWVQFFDEHIALHGAYWHDWFGFARSHGCVNIPVGDAKWVWDWVQSKESEWGPDKGAFWLPDRKKAPFVYVYHSPKGGETRLT
jgi:hypothetical protein